MKVGEGKAQEPDSEKGVWADSAVASGGHRPRQVASNKLVRGCAGSCWCQPGHQLMTPLCYTATVQ